MVTLTNESDVTIDHIALQGPGAHHVWTDLPAGTSVSQGLYFSGPGTLTFEGQVAHDQHTGHQSWVRHPRLRGKRAPAVHGRADIYNRLRVGCPASNGLFWIGTLSGRCHAMITAAVQTNQALTEDSFQAILRKHHIDILCVAWIRICRDSASPPALHLI